MDKEYCRASDVAFEIGDAVALNSDPSADTEHSIQLLQIVSIQGQVDQGLPLVFIDLCLCLAMFNLPKP